MKFGPIRIEHACGAVLAHSVHGAAGGRLAKGKRLDADDIALLGAWGFETVVAAQLDAGDVAEDDAALEAARGLVGPGLTAGVAQTGRVNLHADASGILQFDREMINALNRLDETIAIATLLPGTAVRAQQIVATIKVMPYAVREEILGAWSRLAKPLQVAAFNARRVALIQTTQDRQKAVTLDKMRATMAARLERAGSTLVEDVRVRHDVSEIAAAIRDQLAAGAEIILISGASAVVDRSDVAPCAIQDAGGRIDHFGMPVDPGNLLVLGRVGDCPVLVLPGCARSIKPNGTDLVLYRLLAGLPVDRGVIMGMGVGGLLVDTPSRPLPRAETERAGVPQIAALVLAAGRSQRMGSNKLLAETGAGVLVRHAVIAALASRARPVIVVTGHEAAAVRGALQGADVQFVHNPAYVQGLSTSVGAGLAAVPDDVDGAVIFLGDMPDVSPTLVDRMIAAYDPREGRAIIVPNHNGQRGNPVLWGRRFFAALQELAGDVGGRALLGRHEEWIAEIPFDESVLLDVDTPEMLDRWRARGESG